MTGTGNPTGRIKWNEHFVSGSRRWYGWSYDFWYGDERHFTLWMPFPERVREWIVDRWMGNGR